MNLHVKDTLLIRRATGHFDIGKFRGSFWQNAEVQRIDRNWSGEPACVGRGFIVKMLWSAAALYVYFEMGRGEPLIVNSSPKLGAKSPGLWKCDVCEIFIAPDSNEPRRYFEFEIAPTAEWLDLAIDATGSERQTDWKYNSGMEAAANISEEFVTMAMKIPWEAFGRRPKAGDIWLGNIFRCAGSGNERAYLAWQPTMTDKPNFHVPEKFGELVFVK